MISITKFRIVASVASLCGLTVASLNAFPQAAPTYFRDSTAEAGLTFKHADYTNGQGAAAAVLDFDNDGWPDLYVTNVNGPNALFKNRGDGTFVDVAKQAGVDLADLHSQRIGSRAVACGDFDNDGLTDLFVINSGPFKSDSNPFSIITFGRGANRLFRNRGDGTFEDATAKAGVAGKAWSQCAAFGDYDGDGWLDLYVGNYIDQLDPFFGQGPISCSPNYLYHNNHDGTFTEVAAKLGVAGFGCTLASGFTDYNNDGRMDLYIVNDFGRFFQPNVLYRNDGPGLSGQWQFTDVSIAAKVDARVCGMGLAVGDYDGDGYLDYYATNIGNNVLLRNLGNGTFENVAMKTGAAGGFTPRGENRVNWGPEFFDFDNDGFLDLYVASGFLVAIAPNPSQQPNQLFRNLGNGTFADVSAISGADDPNQSRGIVLADFDHDGDLDLVVVNNNGPLHYFRNEYNTAGHKGENNWIEINLRPRQGHREAFGARVKIVVGSVAQIREIGSGSPSGSVSSLVAHFGLGPADHVDSMEIHWPSGTVETLSRLPANRIIEMTEGTSP